MKRTPGERFREKVALGPNDCLVWQGSGTQNGYGKFWDGRRSVLAHRWSYEQQRGPIPNGMQLHHECRSKRCVDPDHLVLVTSGDNTRRASAEQTHCKNGHRFNKQNTYHGKDGRHCRACKREWAHEHWPELRSKQHVRRVRARAALEEAT